MNKHEKTQIKKNHFWLDIFHTYSSVNLAFVKKKTSWGRKENNNNKLRINARRCRTKREPHSVNAIIMELSKDIPHKSSRALRMFLRVIAAAAVDVLRVLVPFCASGELGAGVLAPARRRRLESHVEALVVVPWEGLSHDVGHERGHHATNDAVLEGQLGVGVAERSLEAVRSLRGLQQVHLQCWRSGREKGLVTVFVLLCGGDWVCLVSGTDVFFFHWLQVNLIKYRLNSVLTMYQSTLYTSRNSFPINMLVPWEEGWSPAAPPSGMRDRRCGRRRTRHSPPRPLASFVCRWFAGSRPVGTCVKGGVGQKKKNLFCVIENLVTWKGRQIMCWIPVCLCKCCL